MAQLRAGSYGEGCPGNSVEYTAIAAPDVLPGFRVHLADLLD